MQMTKSLEVQKLLQEKMGNDVKSIQYLRDNVLACSVELNEVLNEFPWKPWKATNYKEVDKSTLLLELVDVHLFLMNIMIHADITWAELQEHIPIKQRVVEERFEKDKRKNEQVNFEKSVQDNKPLVVCRSCDVCSNHECPHARPHVETISCRLTNIVCHTLGDYTTCQAVPE